jgi:exonuclease 1
MHRVRMLIHFGIIPYLVFDGDYLPSKSITEVERSKRRAESRKLGLELLKMGKGSQASIELQKAVDVTPAMARQLIDELKLHNIQYVVAPYEADAQMAYLERNGIVQGVISEDSDLLVFGVKRLITKLDQYGECIEINRRDFASLRSINIVDWTDADFRRMAILSGCDYLPNISKMGLKTAHRMIRKHKTVERILRAIAFDGQFQIPQNYLENFNKAELTFLHQRVYDPVERELVMLTPFEGTEPENFDFIGKHVPSEIARGVARGDLDPTTKARIVTRKVSSFQSPSPWNPKRSTTISTPAELKSGKPIDEFFKPGRIPLAELDPNSFTPSPSQQRLLEQQNNEIYSTPVHAPTPTPIPTTVSSAPASIRFPRNRNSSSGSVRQHPPKRQRLCADDAGTNVEDVSTNGQKSQFFISPAPEPSPSIKVKKRSINTKNLWSDDSFEDAMAQLPDVWNDEGNSEKLDVFCDNKLTTVEYEATEESQVSTSTTLSTETSRLSAKDTPPSSIDVGSQSQMQITEKSTKRMSASFQKLAKRYSLPAAVEKDDSVIDSPLIMSQIQKTATRRIFTDYSSLNINSLKTPTKVDPVSYPKLPPSIRLTPTNNSEEFVTVPESPQLNEAKALINGSEDCLVPCSDVESDIEEEGNSEQSISIASKILNLKRFEFAG